MQNEPAKEKPNRELLYIFAPILIATLVLVALVILRINSLQGKDSKNELGLRRFSVMFPFIRDRERLVLYDAERKEGWILNEDTERTLSVGPLLANAEKESLARLGIKEERLHMIDPEPRFESFHFKPYCTSSNGANMTWKMRRNFRTAANREAPPWDADGHSQSYLLTPNAKPGVAPALKRD